VADKEIHSNIADFKPKTDASAVVISFGKHKGSTVAELLSKDPQYAEWIMTQGWLADRFAEVHAALAARGAQNEDTPEHNRLQARFLDPLFRHALLQLIIPKTLAARLETLEGYSIQDQWSSFCSAEQRKAEEDIAKSRTKYPKIIDWNEVRWDISEAARSEYNRLIAIKDQNAQVGILCASGKEPCGHLRFFSSVQFEIKGVDASVDWTYSSSEEEFKKYRGYNIEKIEIKPEVGDDYPSIMRQMNRLECRFLVTEKYNGLGVSEPEVKQMFESNRCHLIFIRDIECEITRLKSER
jgi:hypothetical protein